MTDSSHKKNPLALDFKSATLYAVRVVLHSADLSELLASLDQRMADAGSFFENEAVVIDAQGLNDTVDWPALVSALREHQLRPIGVMANDNNLKLAGECGLEPVDLSSAPATRAPAPAETAPPPVVAKPAAPSTKIKTDAQSAKTEPASTPAETGATAAPTGGQSTTTSSGQPGAAVAGNPPTATMVINRPLRSGQRIYARGTDLIVIGMVSQGAEVIADGNIHVYGPLRGKAMAGARGDTSAKIFTTQLNPELLAVAGVYRVVESALDPALANQPAIVQLEGETLQIVPLGTKG
ncbi:septum site-determining protein MinC [Pusillimonas minor]|uniref:Probable septum site-determining protein MinC n=1 Tax=Pusillimonas minor TaxID=2697024 RepID=A0A842HN88_9BURK|nr:septum site-determining protein MinC [Pusillimonas minor]